MKIPSKLVPISGAVLAWAREESGLSQEELAEALKVAADLVAGWESGEAQPTKGQFGRLVQKLKRPSAVFFLPQAPDRAALPTSFRHAPGLAGHKLGEGEIRQIRWARRLQAIVSWALRDRKADPVQFDRFSTDTDPVKAAAAFRSKVGVTPAEQLAWKTPSDAFRAWRSILERLGILVLQLQLGKGNIRGFSAWDDRAPVVAANTAYHPTARIFTLFHEIGHLLTRTDAACLRFILPADPESGAERWCERFSAALLISADALVSVAAQYGINETQGVRNVETARRIAGRFKVSTRAVSLRLQELRLAPPTLYQAVEQELSGLDWNPKTEGGGGQPAPEKRIGQLGSRIPEVLLQAATDGRLNRSDLADYFNLTTGQVEDLRSLVTVGE